jgi:hypothetical protein
MLDHPQAGMLARLTLLDELTFYRMEEELLRTLPGSERYKELERSKDGLARRYAERLEALEKLNPWTEETNRAEGFRLVLSEIIKGYQEYYSKKQNRLFDGFMTLAEIEVECRQAVQVPEPQYRAGIAVMVNAARAGLWDPNWQLKIPFKFLRRLDVTWKKTMAEVADEQGLPLVDLLDNGPAGEFPPLETLAVTEAEEDKD